MKRKIEWIVGITFVVILSGFAVNEYLQWKLFDEINHLPPTASGYSSVTYYVSPSGLDANPGTNDKPFQTIQFAADIVNPGDTVIVKDGVYTTTNWAMVLLNRSGISGYPITFKSENPNGAKLQGNNNATEYGWHLDSDVAYINIKDFDVADFSKIAFYMNKNSNIQIVGNTIHDIGRLCTDTGNGLAGVYISSGSNVIIRNNLFRDIGRYAAGENECQPTNQYYQNHDHGIYMDGASNVTVQANAFYNFRSGWGIQFYSGRGVISSNININSNIFSNPNPYRDGHIVFASPGVSAVSVTNNQFYQPRTVALNFNTGISYSSVTVTNNFVYGAVSTLSKIPSGISATNNKTTNR